MGRKDGSFLTALIVYLPRTVPRDACGAREPHVDLDIASGHFQQTVYDGGIGAKFYNSTNFLILCDSYWHLTLNIYISLP